MLRALISAITILTLASVCWASGSSPSGGKSDSRNLAAVRIAASEPIPRRPLRTEPEIPGHEPAGGQSKGGAAGVGGKIIYGVDIAFTATAVGGVLLTLIASTAALFYSRRRAQRRAEESNDRSSGAAGKTTQNAESDIVEVSVFAPAVGRAEEEIFVQLFFHKPEQAELAETQATSIDPTATQRGKATLDIEISRGERIDVILEGPPSVKIDESSQYLIWRGETRSCQFVLTLPAVQEGRKTVHLRARFLLAGVPIGSIRFPLVVSSFEQTQEVEWTGQSSEHARRAFLSYASADRAEVLKRMQALKVANIECFQDLLNLEPGERWERRLYEEIDRCDMFVLFWSSAAANSEWVTREAEYALKRQKAQGAGSIAIAPIILEGPPIPAAPEMLREIHFNDALRYVISAVEAEANALRVREKFPNVLTTPAKTSIARNGEGETLPKWIVSAKSIANNMINS